MSNTFTHVYVELDGVMTRYPYALFASQFVQYVPEPASPLTEGTQGLFSASDWDLKNGGESISSSAFVYSNNAWRKIPTYTTNWDDIEPSVDEEGAISYLRFLPVHKVIELSDIEKQNVKTSIDVNKATQDNLGLVKGSGPSDTYGSITVQEDGSITSDLATTIFAGTVILDNAELPVESITNKVYTKEAIDALLVNRDEYPVASKLEKGVIFVGDNLSITDAGVLSVPMAAVQSEDLTLGVVKYAPEDFKLDESESDLEENSFVLSLAQIRALIAYYIEQINTNQGLAIASKDILGGIKVDPNSTSLYYITEGGLLDVKQASASTYGTVKFLSSDLYDTISSNVTAIPTAYNIVKYINSKLTGDGGTIQPSKLPAASVSSLGAIKVGSSLSITDGVLNVPTAVSNTNNTIAGIVTLTQDIEHNISKALVPTTYAVDAYITAKLSTLSTDNELVPSASSSRAGIVYVQNASNETASSGVYKVPTVGYLTSVINNLTNYIPTATATTPGIVSVLYGDDESQSSPFAPKVPTVNYVNSQIAEAINNALGEGGDSGGSSSSTPKYLAWLVIGTASFTKQQVDLALEQFNGVLGYGGLSVSAFMSNSVSEALAPGINVFVFNKELSSPEITSFLYYFIDEPAEEGEMQGSGSGGEEGIANNFVILPASGTFGNYVGVNY